MNLSAPGHGETPQSASDPLGSLPHPTVVLPTAEAFLSQALCVLSLQLATLISWLPLLLACGVVLPGFGCGGGSSSSIKPPEPAAMFKPQEMADAIHAVVAADRRAYATHVTPLANRQPGTASSNLPSPSQMLRLAAQEVQKQGAEFHYVLRSLSPLNPKNAPETATEKSGLEFVLAHPDTNFYSEEFLGGRRYLTAVYPDVAFSAACTDCHNRQTQASTRPLKPGEVLGGLIVRVPLEF